MESIPDLSAYLLVVFFLICSGFFSGSETALLSLSRFRVKQLMKDRPVVGKKIEQMVKEPDHLIGALLVGNNIVNVAGTALATAIAISLFGKQGILVATAGDRSVSSVGIDEDALEALANLGYDRRSMIRKLQDIKDAKTTEERVKRVLQTL